MKQKQEPFFLYLAYNASHTPIQPPQEWLEKVKKCEPSLPEKRAKIVALMEHIRQTGMVPWQGKRYK